MNKTRGSLWVQSSSGYLGNLLNLESSFNNDLLDIFFPFLLTLFAKIEPSEINTSPANWGFRIDPLTIILEETFISVNAVLMRVFSIESSNGPLSMNVESIKGIPPCALIKPFGPIFAVNFWTSNLLKSKTIVLFKLLISLSWKRSSVFFKTIKPLATGVSGVPLTIKLRSADPEVQETVPCVSPDKNAKPSPWLSTFRSIGKELDNGKIPLNSTGFLEDLSLRAISSSR